MKTVKKSARLSVDWREDTWVPRIAFARFATPVPRLSPLPLLPANHRCYALRATSLFTSRGTRGFTLIEMLVVIGIIAILAGLLLPAVSRAKTNAKKAQTRSEMQNLIAAIASYESEYSRPPAAPEVEGQINNTQPDFTYGTHTPGSGSTPVLKNFLGADLQSVRNGYGYEADNRVVMNVILDRDAFPNQDHKRNPRRHVTFNAKRSPGGSSGGLDDDGVLRDPFGNPYIITIDMNEDNMCRDAYYSPNHPTKDLRIPGSIIIWSFGPDGKIMNNPSSPVENKDENSDNVLSWRN